jgi:nitrite reductase (NO-forming)
LSGKVVVNGQEFASVMPSLTLNDEDIANVLTFVYSQWDNNGTEITPVDVKKIRAAGPSH